MGSHKKNDKSLSDVNHKQLPHPKKFDGTLFVKGFKLQTISNTSSRVLDGVIPGDAFRFAGWKTYDDTIPDILWRTLVADRGPDGNNVPAWYRRACLECLMLCNSSGDLNTNHVKTNKDTPTHMKMFLERVQSVVWSRIFFLTEPDDYFGLAPKEAKQGDIVCILYGCSVLVVLLQLPNKYYEFIGECFVHGVMEDEALPRVLPDYPYGHRSFTIA